MANLTRYRGTAISPWQPPPVGADIDWSNYFAQGLGFCALLNERNGFSTIDLVSRTRGTTINTSTSMWGGGLNGGGVIVPGGPNNGTGSLLWSNARPGDVTATGSAAQFTVECVCSFTTSTVPTNTHFLSKNSDLVGGGVQGGWLARMPFSSSIDFVVLDSTSTGLNMRITFPSFATFTRYHLVWVYNKGTGTIFLNGRSIGSSSGTPGSISNTKGMQIGKVTDGSSAFPGVIYHGRMWPTRALTGADVAKLYNDPYGMFVYPGRRIVNAKFFATGRRRWVNIW